MLLLDEFANLGRLDDISKALGLEPTEHSNKTTLLSPNRRAASNVVPHNTPNFETVSHDRMPVLLARQDHGRLVIREGRCRALAARAERSSGYVAGLETGQCVGPGRR
jgi:hypothetical protein